MKGAQSLEAVGTGPTQGDVLADDVLDARLVTDCRDVAIGNSACHATSVVTGSA